MIDARIARIGRLFRRRDESGRPDMPLLSVYRDLGVVPRDGRDDNFNRPGEDLSVYQVVRSGDLVLNKMKTWQGSLGISGYDGIVSPAYFVAEPSSQEHPRYLHYVLRSTPLIAEYARYSKGIRPNQWDLPWEAFRDIKITLPSIGSQRAIAAYLDRETARIDALIAAKRRMLHLLRERFDLTVRHSLTYDWDHPRPQTPLKRRWRVIDCKHRTPTYVHDGIPVVSPGDATPGVLSVASCTRYVSEADYFDLAEGARRPRLGDVVYTRNASIGTASLVVSDARFCMGQDVCLIRGETEDGRYLTYALNTLGLDQLNEIKIGSTFSRINVAQIAELLIPVATPLEQKVIADQLDAKWRSYDRARSTLERQLLLLEERRRVLITAAVTGDTPIPDTAA